MADRRAADRGDLPDLEVLVDAADAALHPWVRAHVDAPVRRTALGQELGFWLDTAARDPEYAEKYARGAPWSGEPAAAYLDRWVPLATGGHVLIGPRYRGLDRHRPFVGVSASDRPLGEADLSALADVARGELAAFAPRTVVLTSAVAAGAWAGTSPDLRQVVGRLGQLRRQEVPAELSTRRRTDVDCYQRYVAIHDAHVARDPGHAERTRAESRADLQALADAGLLLDVLVDGAWAGLLAAEPDARGGVRGATVVELLLDHPYRGRGLGRHLSVLLARAVPMPDDQCLLGTIHHANQPSLHSALAAGRVDVGGEVVVPL